ncbi:hypothetical protein TNCV_3159021 [Trichonephila clavipes]|nr:hypothetical protein TNCV_3159021 [Trichonephila clavipes]
MADVVSSRGFESLPLKAGHVKRLNNTRHVGDEPHHFEPRLSGENDTRAVTPSPNYHTVNGKTLNPDRFNAHLPALYGRSSVAPGLEPATRLSRVHDHNH